MNSSLPLRSMRTATVICAFPDQVAVDSELEGDGQRLSARPMRCSASVRAGASAAGVLERG